MTTITAPNVPPETTVSAAEPINLYRLGMLFVIKCRYWSCRTGNDPGELDLSQGRIDAKAIAGFGTKDLLDPTGPPSSPRCIVGFALVARNRLD